MALELDNTLCANKEIFTGKNENNNNVLDPTLTPLVYTLIFPAIHEKWPNYFYEFERSFLY